MTSRNDEKVVALLCGVLQQFDCTSGTLHRDGEGELMSVALPGIPDPVLARIGPV